MPMPGNTRSILIVEDHPVLRKLLVTIARRTGLDVDEARDGVEALELLSATSYALVVLDLMLPRLSGHDLLHRMASGEHQQRVVLVTAASDEEIEQVRSSTVVDVVRKPFDIGELEELMLSALKAEESKADRAREA
ncbi:MAG: response regulator [Acidobacteria bacterium]|nr:response regulator [Acidobacteriota bacterium]